MCQAGDVEKPVVQFTGLRAANRWQRCQSQSEGLRTRWEKTDVPLYATQAEMDSTLLL